jgi:hypothetical protein
MVVKADADVAFTSMTNLGVATETGIKCGKLLHEKFDQIVNEIVWSRGLKHLCIKGSIAK